jgi:hypothetical protein
MVGALLDNAPQQCESDLVQRAMVLTSVCDPVAYIEGIAVPSDKAPAELMVDSNAMLAGPIITQPSSLLPGGIRRSSSFPAEWSIWQLVIVALVES